MRIVVNAVAVRGGGGQTFLLNILEALCVAEPRHDYSVVLTRRQHAILPLLPAGVRPVVCGTAPRAPWLRILWEQLALPGLLRRWHADLLLAGFNTAVLRSPVPVVLVVHSVNAYSTLPIRWSPYMTLRLAALRWLGGRSARMARSVVFVSETGARVMAPRMRVPPARVRVVPYGWRGGGPPPPEPPAALATLGRYLLTVGDLLEHKNVEVLLEALERLVAASGYPGHLVIVGSLETSPSYARRLLQLRDGLACRSRVHFIGSLPHAVLPAVYRRAELFVFPSLEETFGLPLVEAMGAGIPVVVADWRLARGGEHGRTNVGPEICGPVAEFFDPTAPASLVAAMQRVLDDPARRDELARAGPARAARFSWSTAAAALLAICEEARTRP
jgi:glycosyltransferase involved in cell wall biosynthesis